jgi:hypothetical protein
MPCQADFLPRLTKVQAQLQNGLQPVKRKRALLASNPPRNSRWEAHRRNEQGGDGMIAPPPGGYDSFPMPEKTLRHVHDNLAEFATSKVEELSPRTSLEYC